MREFNVGKGEAPSFIHTLRVRVSVIDIPVDGVTNGMTGEVSGLSRRDYLSMGASQNLYSKSL
jgi:hypothetical protein